MKLLLKPAAEELATVKRIASESFADDLLFMEFGAIQGAGAARDVSAIQGVGVIQGASCRAEGPGDSPHKRRKLVARYMDCYVDFLVQQKALWANDDLTGFVALLESHTEKFFPTMRLLRRLKKAIPKEEYAAFQNYSSEVADVSSTYRRGLFLEVLMLCVDEPMRGQGLGGELMDFCKTCSLDSGLPLVIDTDMPENVQMYEHMRCELVNSITASNGVTRFNLVWDPQKHLRG